MATQAKQPSTDDKSINWEKATSKKGVPYQTAHGVGKPRDSSGCVDVDWEPGTSGNPSQDIQDQTGITWYSLKKISSLLYTWELQITTRASDITYTFTDRSPDEYSLYCLVSGNHSVDYNSSDAAIVKICWA
ncbi:hypothetical protein QBC47DRAFT_459417 [Echria macrotheca]|uniref:Uncharacterized protein n=1 Tax=Echria macrotheca TaxID=438768 RepID=A0AAJ0BF28_9PEZI|nr:hypothetical protein QBC47DRAFT_459417 [Echria macrotheca]